MNMVEREGRGSPRPYGAREKEFERGPRIPLCSIRGYFRFFPPGRGQLLLRFGEGWNHLRQQKSIMQLPCSRAQGEMHCATSVTISCDLTHIQTYGTFL
jgi:hypothetical protein